MCTHTHTFNTHTHTHTHIHTHLRTHTSTHSHAHTCLHTYTHTHTCTHTHLRTHAHTHTFTRTHTLACAHTPTQLYIRAKVSVKTATVSSAEGGRNGEKKIGKGAGGLQGRGVCVGIHWICWGCGEVVVFRILSFQKHVSVFFLSLLFFCIIWHRPFWLAFKNSCKFILLMKCSCF